MGFDRPEFLWGLLALPLLLILSLWRMRPRRVVVPSLALWKKIPERNPPIKAVRRPYFSLSMILQALAILSAVFGAAGIYWSQTKPVPRNVVVILDTSPAMMVRKETGGQTRLDVAKERLDNILKQLRDYDRVTLIGRGQVVREPQMIPEAARRALAEIQASFCDPGDLERMVKLAGVTAKDWNNTTTLLASWRDLQSGTDAGPVEKILVGGDHGNMGIVDWNVKEEPAGESRLTRWSIFVRVDSTFTEARTVPIRIMTKPGEEKSVTHEIKTGPNPIELARLVPAQAAEVLISLDVQDRFSWDNTLALTRSDNPYRIGLVGRNNPFLIKALTAIPGVEVTYATHLESGNRADLLILNEYPPPADLNRDMVILRPASKFWEITLGSEPLEGPPEPSDHEIFKDLHIDRMSVRGGREILSAGGSHTALTVHQKPVVIFLNKGGHNALIVSLDIGRWMDVQNGSAWTFPVFWSHVCGWFQKKTGVSHTFEAYPVCSPIRFRATETAEVELHDGGDRQSPVRVYKEGPGQLAFQPERPGTFALKGSDRKWSVSVLNPGATGSIGEDRTDPQPVGEVKTGPVRHPLDLGCVVAFLVLAVAAWLCELRGKQS